MPEPIRLPSRQTLAKYGLTLDEWLAFIPVRKGVKVCPICGKAPKTGRFVVDHQHVANWKRMPPERRRVYVRGVVCTTCNHFVLTRYGNPDKHRAAARYLDDYEYRRTQ